MGQSISGRGWAVAYDLLSSAALPIALGLDYERMGMVCEAIEGCAGQPRTGTVQIVPEHLGPFLKGPIVLSVRQDRLVMISEPRS